MAAEESIKVVVRVRKLLEREKEEKKVFKVQDSAEIYHEASKKTWTFDRVFGALEGNRAVYFDTVSSIIESAVSGFNATIFAYGQTSSGKTYTMMGTEEDPGVTKQAIEQLFYAVEETPDRCFLMTVSYLEIYNENVMDLLDKGSTNLKLRENESGNVYVEGVKTIPVTCAEEVYKIMEQGEKNRHYAETKMNDRSSRSHTIFRIVLESINRLEETINEEDDDGEGRQSMIAYLNLVDLAGSEKAGQTGAEGTRLKEGGNINKSLMMLGQVIQKLSSGDKNLFINYRDSKLTRLLQNSLGGNAKTAIICTITPALMSEEQTLSTLRFASQAKTIKTHATINEVLDDQAKMAKLKRELAEREKEKLELLRKVEELISANQNGEQSRQTRELLEQLEAERTEKAEQLQQLQLERSEKAEQIAKNRWLQEKILVSSQPAKPSKKSLLLKNRNRRETWAAPRVSTVSRASFGFHAFSRPLPVFEQPSAQPTLEVFDDVFVAPRSSRKVQFLSPHQPSCSTLVEEDEEGVSPTPTISMSLDSSILDISLDNGTPKAIIRDRYKRVSRQLTAREQELLRQERELKRVTMEYQELEEFARLESETGVHEDRFTSRLSTASNEDFERVKYLEKNFSDAETLNLELNKTLRETRLELESVSARYEIMKEKYDALCITEKELQEKWKLLEAGSRIQTEELKGLKERCRVLEGEHQDSDMKMELAVNRKETENKELRKVLESAYEEISVLERGDKTAVKERFDKIANLQRKVQELEEQVAGQSSLVCERNQLKEDLSRLQAGFTEVCDEMEQISEEKLKLEQEIKNIKTNSGAKQVGEMVGRIAELSEQVEKSEMRAENLELGNQSLLHTLDQLTKQQEEMRSRIQELSELSSRLENSNSEFQTEILQLRDEIQMVRLERDKVLQEKMKMEEEKTLNEEEKSKNEAEVEEDLKIKQIMTENLESIEKAKMDLGNEKEMLKISRLQLEEEQRKFEEEKAAWEDVKLHQQVVQTSDAISINEKVEEENKKWEEERETLTDDMKSLIKEKEALSEEKEILIKEMETLFKEKTTLFEKNDGLSQEKKTLSEEKNRLLEEKETLSEEMGTLSEEKNRLTEEKNRLLEEKKTLFEEKNSLIKEKENLFEEKKSLDEEKKTLLELLEEKNSVMEEKEMLSKEKISLIEEKKSLVEEKNCLIKERETFFEERNSLIEENKTLSEEKKTLTEEQNRLLEENKIVEQKRKLCLEHLSEAEDKIHVLTAASTDREIKISEQEDQFEILNAQIQEQNIQIQEQSAQIQELKAEILNHTASLENQNIKLEGKSSQILDLESKVDVLQTKLNKSEMLCSEVIAEQEQDREEIKKLVTANINLEAEIDLLRTEQGRDNNSAKKKALATLNATLSNLEETLQTELEETMSQTGEQTMNTALGNMTFGPGEMAEMRNQLLTLQEQLIHFDFEDYETKKNENKNLIAEMSELKKKICSLEQSSLRAAEEQEKLADELTEKHRIQVSIISTKMREELNINLPALEDRIREEVNEKKAAEVAQLKSLHEKEIAELKQAGLAINKLNISTNHAIADTSFDETINFGTNRNFGGNQSSLFQSGPGESLEVQMLRGELNTLREELEHKKSELEEFKHIEQSKTSTELDMGSPTNLDDAKAEIVRLKETISKMESSHEPGKFEGLALPRKEDSLDQSTDEIKILKRDLDAALTELQSINEERENLSLKSQTDANLANLNETAKNYSELKERFDNISENLEMMKKENSELKCETNELNSLKFQLESELANVQEEFSALKIDYASIEEEAELVQQSAEQLIQTNENLKSRVEELEKSNVNLSHELSDLNDQIDDMQLEFDDQLSEQVDLITSELTNTAEALTKEVNGLKLEKSTLEVRLDSRINELEAIEVKFKMIKNSELALKEQILLLQSTLNSAQTLLNDEKTSNKINMKSKVELETLKDRLQQEMNNLKIEKDMLHKKSESETILCCDLELRLAESNSSLKNHLQATAEEREQLLKSNAELVENNVHLQAKIDDLENQVVVQETLMDKLESEVGLRKELEIRVLENNKYITDLEKEVQRLQTVPNDPKDTLRLGNNMEENEEDSELSVEEQLAQALKNIKILEETRGSAYKQYKEIEEILEKECDKLEAERDQVKEEKERLAEELDETKKRFDETLVMVETMKDTSKHKNETSREDEEEEGDLRDKLTKAEKDVKMYRERHEAAMKYSQENDEFYEKECDKLESERDAARLEKTRLEEELKQVRSLLSGNSNTSPFSVCQSEEKTMIGNSTMDFTRVAGEEGFETISEVWREEKMRLETELKKMEEIKINLEIEIQDLRKDAPVETKVELERLRNELEEHKKTMEKIQEKNSELSAQLQLGYSDESTEVVALRSRLKEVMAKLSKKHSEYASLKVDVDREHLPFQIKNKQLEDELEHEKRVVQRLTNDLRLMQTEKMDCTVVNTKPRVHSSSINTSISGSPEWTSGSGTIKEIRLYELEHKTRRLEKENASLMMREEFYINKGSEWKGRAKRYEVILDENGINYRKRSDDSNSEPDAAATSAAAAKENVKPNELDDLDLGLNQEKPRREFRLPADQRKRKENDCKTQ